MPRPEWITRFTRAERWVHHATAVLLLCCLVTAAMLYVGPIAAAVGHRDLVRTVHIVTGFCLPGPMLLGWLSAAYRADLRRLNRFQPADWDWLRRSDRRLVLRGRGIIEVGKFNAGQKLNAAFVGGAILVMLGTGAMLTFPDPWPDALRTGATFVHDWLTAAIVVVLAGHLTYALRDPEALRGIWVGRVRRDWAARDHPAWLDAYDRDHGSTAATEDTGDKATTDATEPADTKAATEADTDAADGAGSGSEQRVR
jgi:cytochrome b subunit of formate dehydrogenase